MRVFLDTNIVLDVLLNQPNFVANSEAVILSCEAASDQMFIAWHGLATASYLLKRGRTESYHPDNSIGLFRPRGTRDISRGSREPWRPNTPGGR